MGRQIKIVSDGTVIGTKIIDVESGELVDDVTAVSWHLDVEDGLAEVSLVIRGSIRCEVEGTVRV